MSHPISIVSQNTYEVAIQGHLDDSWSGWYEKIEVRNESGGCLDPMTLFITVSTDQAGLVGLIRRLHGMGIVLLAVKLRDQTNAKNEIIDGEK